VDSCGRLPTLSVAGLLALAVLMGSPVPSQAAQGQGQKPQQPDNAMDAGLIKAIDQVMALVALEHQMGERVPGLDSGLRHLMQALLNQDGQARHHHHRHHRHHHRFGDGMLQAGGNDQGQIGGNAPQSKPFLKNDPSLSSTSSKARHKGGACASVGQTAGKKCGKERANAERRGNPNQPGACLGAGGKTGGRLKNPNKTVQNPGVVDSPKKAGQLANGGGRGNSAKINNGQRLTAAQGNHNKTGAALNTGASTNKGKTGTGTLLVSAAGNKGASGGNKGDRCGFKAGIGHAGKLHGSGSKKR
jgi:hypothetical protein